MNGNILFWLDFGSQCIVPVLGITAMILVSYKIKWGFVIGLASQPFWIITALINHQWGSLISAIFFVFAWANGIYQWFSVKTLIPKPNSKEFCELFSLLGKDPLMLTEKELEILLIEENAFHLKHRVNTLYRTFSTYYKAILEHHKIKTELSKLSTEELKDLLLDSGAFMSLDEKDVPLNSEDFVADEILRERSQNAQL